MSDFLTAEEAAAKIGMKRDYIARMCNAGHIKAKKLGNQWRIAPAALDEFMGLGGKAEPTRKRLSARQMRRAS